MDIAAITVPKLALSFIPVAIVVVLMWRWGQGYRRSLQAIARMLIQLTLIGYVLVYIFQAESGLIISGVLGVMLVAASWIALNTVDLPRSPLFVASLTSVVLGGGSTLALITQGVLGIDPWYQPSVMIPLAGMIFAASMTNISLALERLHAELSNGVAFDTARETAFRTSMIPVINSFLAVGLISLPGMMTGQILSGVSPLIAVRYQIMVMCMIFGAAGLSTVCFLVMVRKTGRFRDFA
ncbi:MAG: ABC transporter permease [Gammaproteobacteria bacterium]|nr:ABC transporter permease [Gammaproteobacteria bacterium]